MKFTENLSELDKLLKKIEANDCTLEEALENFEKAVAMLKDCKKFLEEAKQKVTILKDEALDTQNEAEFDDEE